MHHSSIPWEISLLYFFSRSFIWFLQKEPTTEQNFRLSTAQVKFYQTRTLIEYFCWKYMKFQLKKKYGEVMSHDTKEWCKIWRETYFFVSKMTRLWWILIWALKSLKNLHFEKISLLCKVYNLWPKKVQRSIFHDTEESGKIWIKTDLWFGKWHEEFGKFSSEHLKMLILVFSWDPLVQSRKYKSYKLTEAL